MKTETEVRIMCETDDLWNRDNWLEFCDRNDNALDMATREGVKKAIEHWGDEFPAELAGAINRSLMYTMNRVAELVSKDLEDIWKRQDQMESSIDFLRGKLMESLSIAGAKEDVHKAVTEGINYKISVGNCNSRFCQDRRNAKPKKKKLDLRSIFRNA